MYVVIYVVIHVAIYTLQYIHCNIIYVAIYVVIYVAIYVVIYVVIYFVIYVVIFSILKNYNLSPLLATQLKAIHGSHINKYHKYNSLYDALPSTFELIGVTLVLTSDTIWQQDKLVRT